MSGDSAGGATCSSPASSTCGECAPSRPRRRPPRSSSSGGSRRAELGVGRDAGAVRGRGGRGPAGDASSGSGGDDYGRCVGARGVGVQRGGALRRRCGDAVDPAGRALRAVFVLMRRPCRGEGDGEPIPYVHDVDFRAFPPSMFSAYETSSLFAEHLLLPASDGKDRCPSLSLGAAETATRDCTSTSPGRPSPGRPSRWPSSGAGSSSCCWTRGTGTSCDLTIRRRPGCATAWDATPSIRTSGGAPRRGMQRRTSRT